jgi:Triosephosphate isomerase
MFASGSYTGEISASMLKEFNVDYVIIGHNERRSIFGEEDKEIDEKIKIALKNNLKVILCITTISELKKSLKNIDDYEKILIAFEPKDYIGTNETITREELIEFIDKINKVTNFKSRILYGGGIKKENIKKLSGVNGLDGLLIGKASLDIEQVKDIISLW